MTDSKQRSVLDFVGMTIGLAHFNQPDMEAAVEKQFFLPAADYRALGEPTQITVTVEVGDLLNEDDVPVSEVTDWTGEVLRRDPDLIGDGEGPGWAGNVEACGDDEGDVQLTERSW